MTGPPPAVLVLEDGWVARGTAFGAASPVVAAAFGEMVFNTGMTGYQETLTDPSYHRQIVAMTAPHIGNTGINDEDHESRRIWVAGYVVREPARIASSWRAIRSLDDELCAQGVIGIAVTGTRALTRHLRDKGAMRAAISTAPGDVADPRALIDRVLASPSMAGADLAREVSTPEPYVVRPPSGTATRYRVAAVDLGIKAATPRKMAERGCEVHVLPAAVTAAEIMDIRPDGVFFSNGPGDPAAAGYAVEAMRGVLEQRMPVFGICLGSQILGRALGLGTYKLLFGHRGVNQPVLDFVTGRVHITSHNHGFAVAPPGATAAGGSRDESCAGQTSDAGLPRGPIVPDERAVSEGAGRRRGVSFADGGRESSVSYETAGGERGVSHGGNGGRQGDVRHGSHRGVSGGARGGQDRHVTSGPCGGEERAGNRDANGGQEGNVSMSRGAGASRETAEADGANEAGVVPAGMMPSAQPFGTGYGRAHVSHACLNDGVVEGLRLLDRPAFGVQYHPEAAPGPHDAAGLFDRFTELMDGGR